MNVLVCGLSGSYAVPISSISGTKLRVSSSDYLYDIAEGNIPNHSPFIKLGFNADVDNATETLTPLGIKYVFPTATGSMIIQSSVIGDTTGSTGIQTLTIGYLDQNFVSKTETVSMNGTTPVWTVATDIYRVNTLRAVTIGASGSANGLIRLSGSTANIVYREMSAGFTRGRTLVYSVPSGSTVYITDINLSASNASTGHYVIFTGLANYDDSINAKIAFMQPWFEMGIQDQAVPFHFSIPIKIPQTCDIVMNAIGDGVSANSICYGSWRGWIES